MAIGLVAVACAGEGDLDRGFNPEVRAVGSSVSAVALQPNGMMMIGGSFVSVGGITRSNLARLRPEGTVDPTFDAQPNGEVRCVALQSDGKILLGGTFTHVGDVPRGHLARLNPDGTLDADFDPSTDGGVMALALQPDGKLVIAGEFTVVSKTPQRFLARLNPNGAMDVGFRPDLDGSVLSLAIQPDARIVIGGSFTTLDGKTRRRVARLNPTGALDADFDPNANGSVRAVALQADGRILIGGLFNLVGGQAHGNLARLRADGAVEAGFKPDVGGNVISIAVQTDGGIVVGGAFNEVNQVPRLRLARFNSNGALDPTLDTEVSDRVFSVSLQLDGRILIAGEFTRVGGSVQLRVARLANGLATGIFSVAGTEQLQWLRSGTGPEVTRVFFDLSRDGGVTWTALGPGKRIVGGWQCSGLELPATGLLRARALVAGGFNNGSSSWLEDTQVLARGDMVSLDIHASETDPRIEKEAEFHVVNIDLGARPRNRLFVFFPGSGGRPDNCRLITATAARLGFHAIALKYPDTGKVAVTCEASPDSNCHGRVRQELIEGVNTSDLIEVSRVESLENRVIQLLRYLDRTRPNEGWSQFLGAQTNILWEKVRLGGLSQGASHAHWIAMKHPVDRCLIFANQDWWTLGKRLSDWQLQPNATPVERYFSFIHSQDVGFRSGHQQVLWDVLGLPRLGPIVLVEKTTPGYLGSHTLTSAVMPQFGEDGEPNYHGSVAVDGSTPLTEDGLHSVFQPVWEYLMAGPLMTPELALNPDLTSGSLQLSWLTVSGMSYRLESSSDLELWSVEETTAGNGLVHRLVTPLETPRRFFRLRSGEDYDFP